MESVYIFLIVAMCVLFPVALIWLPLHYSYRKSQERNRLIKQMIESGNDQEHVLALINAKGDGDRDPVKHFKSGMTLIAVGLGLLLIGALGDNFFIGIGGLITIVGMAELVVSWYLRKYSK